MVKVDVSSITDWSQVEKGFLVAKPSGGDYTLEIVDRQTLKIRKKEKDSVTNLNQLIQIFNKSVIDKTISDEQVTALQKRMESGKEKHNKSWVRILRFLGVPLLVAKILRKDTFSKYDTPVLKKEPPQTGNPPPQPNKNLPSPLPKDNLPPPSNNPPPPSAGQDNTPITFHKSDEIIPRLDKKGELIAYLNTLKEDDIEKVFEAVLDQIENQPKLSPLVAVLFTALNSKTIDFTLVYPRMVSLLERTDDSKLAKAVIDSMSVDDWREFMARARHFKILETKEIPILFSNPLLNDEKKLASAEMYLKGLLKRDHLNTFFQALPETVGKMNPDQSEIVSESYLGLSIEERLKSVRPLLRGKSEEFMRKKILVNPQFNWLRPLYCAGALDDPAHARGGAACVELLKFDLKTEESLVEELKVFAEYLVAGENLFERENQVKREKPLEELNPIMLEILGGNEDAVAAKYINAIFEVIVAKGTEEHKRQAFVCHYGVLGYIAARHSNNVPLIAYDYGCMRPHIANSNELREILSYLDERSKKSSNLPRIEGVLKQLLRPREDYKIPVSEKEIESVINSFSHNKALYPLLKAAVKA